MRALYVASPLQQIVPIADEFMEKLRYAMLSDNPVDEPYVDHRPTDPEAAPSSRPWRAATRARSTVRGAAWQALLRIDAEHELESYVQLVARGPCPEFERDIRKDVPRTFPTDDEYVRKTPDEVATRVLHALAHWLKDAAASQAADALLAAAAGGGPSPSPVPGPGPGPGPGPVGYMQGMHRWLGPLLSVMPEAPAFACLRTMVTRWAPGWFGARLAAVREGSKLVEQLLAETDPVLHAHLESKNSGYGRIVAYPRLLSLYACMRPLPEVLRVWDALLARGPALVILLPVAEFMGRRDALLAAPRNPAS